MFWLILQVVALGQDGRGDKSQSSQVVESVGVSGDWGGRGCKGGPGGQLGWSGRMVGVPKLRQC